MALSSRRSSASQRCTRLPRARCGWGFDRGKGIAGVVCSVWILNSRLMTDKLIGKTDISEIELVD
jgi:hypothetical protein